ncbi:MAG: metallophosphoesterase [Clostridia bacterium]|nr:metallophosphoesterase [Clostridia bacterium]
MKRKFGLKAISVILVVAILAACVPMMVSADTSAVRFGVVSDIHYLAESLKGEGEAWDEFVYDKHKEYNDVDALLNNALDGVERNAVDGGENYLLIPGDLTKDGEYESHVALAERLEQFEAETGIPVLVIPGNHDVNNTNAATYVNGKKETAKPTSPEDFREIYADLGYDLADSFFVPEEGKKGGMLSYAATLGGYRLICIDSNMYSEDNGAEGNEHMTDGRIADGLLDWIVAECEKAKEQGLTLIGMQHHNLVPHISIEEATLWAFVVQNWMEVAETYADAGMHYVFTGHLHANNVAKHVSDNGEAVYDILTPTLTGFPNYYRTVDFVSDGETTTMDMKSHDIDEYQPVIAPDGTAYEKPFKFTYSFDRTFGEGGIKGLAMGALRNLVNDYFPAIQEAGGLLGFLKTMNLDLEKIIVDALGTNGLALGPVEILTVSSNVMGFIGELAGQIDEVYVNNPEETLAKVEALIDRILNYKVCDKPASMLTDVLGYEVNPDGCTFGEYATTILICYYGGDEDISAYPYVTEVLDRFESGELAQEVFNLLREVLVTDLVQGEILANLDFNPGELFPEGNVFYLFGRVLQGITELLLGGDNSFTNLIDSVLSIPLVPEEYSSVDAIIDHLMGEYITQSQYESWGYTIKWMLITFVLDSDPAEKSDSNAVITYSGPEKIEATQDNYRAPSHIAVTLGEDSTSEVSITWLTKYSVKGTDIELVPYSENPKFTGRPTTGKKVTASYELIPKTYPGADLGVFALLLYSRDYVKHTVKLSGLEAGAKYCYRVGDAERGWWSEAGVIETAAGGNEKFTFFYVTDPQSQQPAHYERFAEVVETAAEEYPDAKFIVSAGDQVDEGENVKHWNYLLNSTEKLLDLPFMPVTGNHEDEGAVITENFVLPNVPEQDLETGVYYSYDYNGVHFTVLNTNDDEDDKLGKAQIEWMKNDIKSSDAKWKVVIFHKAIYSNGSHYDDGDVKGMRDQLSALLPYLGVDLVLQGHDHVYLRTDVMNANAVVPVKTGTVTYEGMEYQMKYNPKGSIYSICGTSGVKVYQTKDVEATDKLFPRAEKLNPENTENSMFAAITVDGDCLYYNAYEVDDGEAVRVDNFAIEKTADESPADKAGDAFGGIIESIIDLLNFEYTWKITNFILSVFDKVMQIIWSIA